MGRLFFTSDDMAVLAAFFEVKDDRARLSGQT